MAFVNRFTLKMPSFIWQVFLHFKIQTSQNSFMHMFPFKYVYMKAKEKKIFVENWRSKNAYTFFGGLLLANAHWIFVFLLFTKLWIHYIVITISFFFFVFFVFFLWSVVFLFTLFPLMVKTIKTFMGKLKLFVCA